jgi:hypothetical protein
VLSAPAVVRRDRRIPHHQRRAPGRSCVSRLRGGRLFDRSGWRHSREAAGLPTARTAFASCGQGVTDRAERRHADLRRPRARVHGSPGIPASSRYPRSRPARSAPAHSAGSSTPSRGHRRRSSVPAGPLGARAVYGATLTSAFRRPAVLVSPITSCGRFGDAGDGLDGVARASRQVPSPPPALGQ